MRRGQEGGVEERSGRRGAKRCGPERRGLDGTGEDRVGSERQARRG